MVEIQPSADLIRLMSIEDILRTFGGRIEGHVTFENGEHGNGYANKGFLRYPPVMMEMGYRLGQQFSDYKGEIDAVIGPSIIGAIIACSTASNLNVPFSTTYRDYHTGEMMFHRGFVPPSGSRCLFADDFIFSGKCAKNNINFMQESGLIVVGVSLIGIRQTLDLEIPIRNLTTINFVKTKAEKCLMCKNKIPIVALNVRE